MRKTVVVAFLVVSACSPAETTESTTTTLAATTSSQLTTSTISPPPTTVAPTTSTSLATTTTSDLLEGNWADEPLVTTGFGALGWWDGSGWLDAESEGALPVVGGEDYQVIRLDETAITTAGPQSFVCPPLDLIGVELDEPDLVGEFPGPYGVAISAPWVLQPHLFDEIPDDGSYAVFARELLSARDLDVADPVIKQLIRTDLEGDGVNEVIVVAEDLTPGFLLEEGDYSIVFLRKVIEGEVQTAILGETIVLDEGDQFGAAHWIGTVADLNGDGTMEIITNLAYFEGFGVSVWEYANDDLGPVVVLETGCGS